MCFLMNSSVALVRHFWEELIRHSNSISILRLDNDLKIAIVTWLCGISKLSKAERIFFVKNQYYDKEANHKETGKKNCTALGCSKGVGNLIPFREKGTK